MVVIASHPVRYGTELGADFVLAARPDRRTELTYSRLAHISSRQALFGKPYPPGGENMRVIIPALAAACLALAAPAAILAPTSLAFAQAQQPGGGEPVKQIALTDKQIDGYVAAKKDVDAVLAKLPESAQGQPDPKVTTQLDDVVKKFKFANYAEYNSVEDNIGLVMQGVDQQTKKYVGPEIVLKQEIAAVKAEKGMSPKDKKEALEQLNAALKQSTPVQFPANIELVTKNFDKISAAMPQDQEQPQKQ